MPDDDVLERAKRGDRDALTDLFKRYGPTARRAIAGRIPKRWQSLLSEDDVMQQTYGDAVFKIGQLVAENEATFAGWLVSIAQRNRQDAVKYLEAEKRGGNRRPVNKVATDESFISLIRLISDSGTTPSGAAGTREALEAMKKMIQQLPEDYRQVVVMYDLEGCPVKEVAEALKRSEGAVFMLRARAHDRLRELMSAFFTKSS
jgi:RNA polymerase sigma-70 factor, ECF subfamily